MSHLRSVDNGTFLLLKEGFMAKITKIQELPGASHPGPHVGLKAAPKPHAHAQVRKNPLPPPQPEFLDPLMWPICCIAEFLFAISNK